MHFDNDKLIEKCIEAVNDMQQVSKTRLQWKKAGMSISKAGVDASVPAVSEPVALVEGDIELPDLLTEIARPYPAYTQDDCAHPDRAPASTSSSATLSSSLS